MINQLKTDPITRLMFIGVIITACFACTGVGIYVYTIAGNPFQCDQILYPSISSDPVAFGLNGEHNHIIGFSVDAQRRILFGMKHTGNNLFTAELTDINHNPIKIIHSEVGDFAITTDEMLSPGNYYLHINGDVWTVGVGNN